MITWPQNWRGDKGMMERFCPHGVGHPDPDDLKVMTREGYGIHGCDGCCAPPNMIKIHYTMVENPDEPN
jgi:hypothetical protein